MTNHGTGTREEWLAARRELLDAEKEHTRRRVHESMTHASTKVSKTWVLALVSAASLMAALDAMVVATSLSTIRVELDVSMETLQWTLNAYNLSSSQA
jgi:hypothetical protein